MADEEGNELLCEVSPNGNVQAIVEQVGDVVIFYLHGPPDGPFPMKSCWVRNLAPAPAQLHIAAMKRGLPPMLPRDACAHPMGAPPLKREDLRIVWFEEGDAAALLEGGEVLAIIPAWSGTEDFWGYARDCTRQGPLCWPLEHDNALFDRIRRAEEFWRSWEEGNPWEPLQEQMLAAYRTHIGPHSHYYAIDGGKWPPKAMVQIPKDDRVVLTTLGVCIRPQPSVEMYVDDPRPYRRIELGMALGTEFPDAVILAAARWLIGPTNYPWNDHTWLGHGHTCPCNAIPPGEDGVEFPSVLLWNDWALPDAIQLPDFRGDPVNLLWTVPITAKEQGVAESRGSETLAQSLAKEGRLPVHRARPFGGRRKQGRP